MIEIEDVENSILDIVITPTMTIEDIRKMGFPFIDYTDEESIHIFLRLKKLNTLNLIERDLIYPLRRFATIATQFFPNFYKTKGTTKMSPWDSFYNDKYLQRALDMGRKYDKPERFTMNSLRNYLKFAYDTRVVSNFNPEVAKFLYDTYGGKGIIYDYAMGWGGRLVGFLSSNRTREYVGVDVNSENFTNQSYDKISNLFRIKDNDFFGDGDDKKITSIKCPSEEFCEYKDYFDCAFSSPAYFNTEKYSDDPEQSFLRYTNYDLWKQGFLTPTIKNCITMLKPNGYFICNIQDVREKSKVIPLVEDMKQISLSLGLQYVITHKMVIATGIGIDKKKVRRQKFEPIVVFRKI
jgi:hypothetical protein